MIAIIKELGKVIQRLHYPLEVMLTCVRWYAAYPLSLRHIEEMMQERPRLSSLTPLLRRNPRRSSYG